MYSPVNKCVIFQSANAVYFPRRSDTPDAVRRSGGAGCAGRPLAAVLTLSPE